MFLTGYKGTKRFMKRWQLLLIFIGCKGLFADTWQAKLTYSGQVPSLEIKHLNDAGAQIATVTYNFGFTWDKLKQTTLVCKTPQLAWAPLEKVAGDPKLATDGLGVRVGGVLFWIRNNARNDGLVISGETRSHVVVTANRVILGNNRETHLHGNLTVNPLKDTPTVMIRGEVVVDGNCIVNSQRLLIDKDSRYYVNGAVSGKFKELITWHRTSIQIGRLDATELVSFQNNGTFVCLGDFIAPKAVVKNVERDNSKVPEAASTLGQLVVNGNCRVVSLNRETVVGKQRNITTQLLEQYGEKRGAKTFLADVEVDHIRKQMLTLVGRRLLPGFTNEIDQLWQFYRNTVEEHHRLKVEDKLVMQLGHLTKEVWEHLKKDVVWLQESTVNGEKLLTLIWFPCKATLQSLHVAPAMVVAGKLNITADGNWVNQGLIEATQGDVKVKVGGVAHNQGGGIISRNGTVNVQAGVGIINTNGLIQGQRGVQLSAPLIVNQTEVVRSGNEDIYHSVTNGNAKIKSGGDIKLEASNKLIIVGSKISTDGDITLQSGDIIQITPSVLEYRSSGGDGSSTYDVRGRHGIFSYITGRNVTLQGQGMVVLEAPRIHAQQELTLLSHRGVQILPFIESEYAHYTWESSGWFSDSSGSTTDLKEHLVHPKLKAGNRIKIHAHDDIETVALEAQTRRLELESETGQIQLKAGRERSYHQEEYEDSGFITTTVHNEGYNRIKVIEPIMVYDDVRVIGRLMTEVKKGRLAPWVVDLCAMYDVDLREVLETHEQWYHHTTQMSMPLRTFLSVALTICTAGWGADYITAHWANASTAVAKGVGAALEGITNTFIVSTIANGGDLGKVFKELTDSRYLKGLVASALASGLVSKFIDKPIVDKAKLADGENAVKTAVNTATKAGKSAAGVGLAAENAAIKNLSFAQKLGRDLRAAALTTGVTTAISGGKFGRNALSGLGAAAVNTVSANLAHQIGERYAHGSGDMSWLTHKVCHFVLGGTAAEFTGGDFLAGGTGATIGEMVADAMIQRALEQTRAEVRAELDAYRTEHGNLPPLQDAEFETLLRFQENLIREHEALQTQVERYGRLAAAGTALTGRMDIEVADASAQNAIENNSVPSIDVLIKNQGKSILDRLLAWEQASIEQGVIEHRAQEQASMFFEPAVMFLCPGYELAKLGFRHYALGEAIPTSELVMAGLRIVPVGIGCAIISKGSVKVAAKCGFVRKSLSESEIIAKVDELRIRSNRWAKLGKEESIEAYSRIGLCGTYKELKPLTKGFGGAIQAHHYALPADLCRKYGIPPSEGACVIFPDVWHYKTKSFGTRIFDGNLRSVTAQGTQEVRSILNEVGFEGPDFHRELLRSLKEHTSKYPNLYEKK